MVLQQQQVSCPDSNHDNAISISYNPSPFFIFFIFCCFSIFQSYLEKLCKRKKSGMRPYGIWVCKYIVSKWLFAATPKSADSLINKMCFPHFTQQKPPPPQPYQPLSLTMNLYWPQRKLKIGRRDEHLYWNLCQYYASDMNDIFQIYFFAFSTQRHVSVTKKLNVW